MNGLDKLPTLPPPPQESLVQAAGTRSRALPTPDGRRIGFNSDSFPAIPLKNS